MLSKFSSEIRFRKCENRKINFLKGNRGVSIAEECHNNYILSIMILIRGSPERTQDKVYL